MIPQAIQLGKWFQLAVQSAHRSDMEDKFSELDKRLALVEQKLTIITDNHLAHLQQDVNSIKRYFLWAVGVVFAQLVGVIVALSMML